MMYIDSHCHLNHRKLADAGTPDDVVTRAQAAGVDGMLTICCRIAEEFDAIRAIAHAHENVWCTVGTHPHDAGKADEAALTLDDLIALTRDPKVVGIGESGLDYFYKDSEPAAQADSFRKHIRACIETGLPLVVHARDADADVIRILREEGAQDGGRLKGVMHCFSSSPAMGRAALDLGFYISLSGMLTFNKSQALRDFAATVPLDRLLIETDAPYLAPEPHRGAVNEPALVIHTCARLAGLHRMDANDMARRTADNFFMLFDKALATRTVMAS